MSYKERLDRVKKLDTWNCKRVHDLITSYELNSSDYKKLVNSVKNYISKAMDVEFYADNQKFIEEIDSKRNLTNVTPNGAVVPKRDYLLEYNIFLRDWKTIMEKVVSPNPKMLNRFRLTPNIRVKLSEEIEENKGRSLNTALPHSDGWLEGPWGMNCFVPLMGDTENNTLKYYEPKEGEFDEKFVQVNPSYKNMQWVLDYYKELKFVPQKNNIYFSDYAMIHNTYKYKKDAGTRISIDTTLYIGDNPPHPDREKEYEKDFIDIGLGHLVDPGRFMNDGVAEKKTTFSHYTSGDRKICKLF